MGSAQTCLARPAERNCAQILAFAAIRTHQSCRLVATIPSTGAAAKIAYRERATRLAKEPFMNKLELVEHVAGELDLSKAKAAEAVEAVLDGIAKAMKKGEEVRLVGFGTFAVKERAAGKGRNPSTGEEITIPASNTVRFKVGAALKEAVNKGK
jgi:DNA-binding protein HU-beta